jgi:hypothetical protein
MKRRINFLAVLAIAALGAGWSGCGSDDNGDGSTTAPVPAATDTAQTGTEDNGGVTSQSGVPTEPSDSGSAIQPGASGGGSGGSGGSGGYGY